MEFLLVLQLTNGLLNTRGRINIVFTHLVSKKYTADEKDYNYFYHIITLYQIGGIVK